MIRVSVHLISANDGSVTELARMDIANDGTSAGAKRNYSCVSYFGRSSRQLDLARPSHVAHIKDWESPRHHVWNLVRACLTALRYTGGQT